MIRVFFGAPGVGKSTLCCKLAKKALKHYDAAYINFRNTVPDVYSYDAAGLGEWTFKPGSYVALDEAGIEYNSRAHREFPKVTLKWFKLHRHYGCDVDVFSQTWDDMDKVIRSLATELWYMYKIGPFTLCRKVYKTVMVDKTTHQIIDGYSMPSMLWLLIWFLQLGYPFRKRFMLTFRPFYYKYFDSWEADDLPIKKFPCYSSGSSPLPPAPSSDMDKSGIAENKTSTGSQTGGSVTLLGMLPLDPKQE